MIDFSTWPRRYQKMGFLGMPDEVIMTLGRGVEGDSLSAFDKAEIDAGIPDVNAMYVTSFVPPGAKLVTPDESREYLQEHPVVPGSLVPAALKSFSTTRWRQRENKVKSDKIFGAIGVVPPKQKDRFPTVMMEYVGPQHPDDPGTLEDVRRYCEDMCRRVVALRGPYGFEADGEARIWIVEAELPPEAARPQDDQWVCVLVAGLYVQNVLY